MELTKKHCRLFKRAGTGDKCFAWLLSYVIRMNKWFHWPDLWQVWTASACRFMRMLSRLSFLMITVRVITQSICETLSTLKKNVLSKSTFYGHCLFENVIGTIELLCVGTCGRCFRRAFFIKSSAFQRNLPISKIVLLLNACWELELPRPRRRKRENNRVLTQRRQRRQCKRQN